MFRSKQKFKNVAFRWPAQLSRIRTERWSGYVPILESCHDTPDGIQRYGRVEMTREGRNERG
eukprot:6829254-Prymnesium_polylepis.1